MSVVLLDEKRLIETLDSVCALRTGLKSGFADFDYFTAGFQSGELYVLGGRPAMGKTMFALNVVCSIAVKQNQPVLYVSLEQPESMIVTKLLQVSSGQDVKNLYLKNISECEKGILREAATEIGNAKIWIDDTPALQVEKLRDMLLENNAEWGIKFIVIDYLQLMGSTGKYQTRSEEVANITRVLKNIARENNLSILVLSQLSRAVECRPDHRPMLSDLRDSGVIEEQADQVYFLYRDDYYNPESECPGIAEVLIAKSKIGPTGTILLKFKPEKGCFENIDTTIN